MNNYYKEPKSWKRREVTEKVEVEKVRQQLEEELKRVKRKWEAALEDDGKKRRSDDHEDLASQVKHLKRRLGVFERQEKEVVSAAKSSAEQRDKREWRQKSNRGYVLKKGSQKRNFKRSKV